jgi:hypothetical protein
MLSVTLSLGEQDFSHRGHIFHSRFRPVFFVFIIDLGQIDVWVFSGHWCNGFQFGRFEVKHV